MKTQTALLYLNNAQKIMLDLGTKLVDMAYQKKPGSTPSELREIEIISKAWEIFERPLSSWHPPSVLCCRISNQLIENAVVTPLGNIYDEVNISRFLYEGQNNSGQPMIVSMPQFRTCEKMNIAVHKFELLREMQFNRKLLATISTHYESPEKHWKTTPKVLRCALTGKLMVEVVSAPGGKLYDRAAIEAYVKRYHQHPDRQEPLSLEQLSPWPYATHCATEFKIKQGACCVEAFRQAYLADFYEQPFYLRNNLSHMKKMVRAESLCMEEIEKHAETKPQSRTNKVLKKMP